MAATNDDGSQAVIYDDYVLESAKSQVRIYLSNGFACNGFFVAPKILMTNNHCVPNKSINVKIVTTGGKLIEKCGDLLHTSDRFDYSLVHCENVDNLPAVTFNVNPLSVGDKIFSIHTNCDYYSDSFCRKRQLFSAGKILEIGKRILKHNADTLGGSSGAPIFKSKWGLAVLSDDGTFVGIHNSGFGNYNHDGRGIYNGGITARSIILEMPKIYRDKITMVGEIDLPQVTSAPFIPVGTPPKVQVVFKKSVWQKVKCFFRPRKCK